MAPRKDTLPQEQVASFWQKYITPNPGKVTSIFPPSLYATLLPRPQSADSGASHVNFGAGYEDAAARCRAKVERLVRDCTRSNTKFTDPDFDIKGNRYDALFGLNWAPPAARGNPDAVEDALAALQQNGIFEPQELLHVPTQTLRKILGNEVLDEDEADRPQATEDYLPAPCAVHRVDWIYEDPKFSVDGYSSSDIIQGGGGDCWWLSAVATICHRAEVMDRICVARNEECGVYGFVFYRDGAFVPVVIDDNLFLKREDFSGSVNDPRNGKLMRYRKDFQTGSDALYFASCKDQNETWLPLLEKAFAKAHGDYNAIEGGFIGEGVEDLTGGVYSEVALEDVLFKQKLWEELLNKDKSFVFGLDLLDRSDKNGLANGHAYSILDAREEEEEDGKKVRLVKIRNPWGARVGAGLGEWNGPWSDGSKEWTPYWLTKLDYRFEDDGIFWMTFSDMLSTFTNLYRTRLFDDQWTVTQEWTGVNVAWLTGYLQHKFVVEVKNPGTVVLVLQQLDARYFRGLEGEYEFMLHFILQKQGAEPGDYIARVRPHGGCHFRANRSVNCEVELEPGVYEVLPKITARRDMSKPSVQDIVKTKANGKPEKLRQVGLSFDLAHSRAFKPGPVKAESQEEKKPGKIKTGKKTNTDEVQTEKSEAKEEKAETGTSEEDGDGWETDKSGDESESSATEDGEEVKKQSNKGEGSVVEAVTAAAAEAQDGDGDDIDRETTDDDEDDEDLPSPWNAVGVIGLRVYSQDPEVAVQLAVPKNAEEASCVIQG